MSIFLLYRRGMVYKPKFNIGQVVHMHGFGYRRVRKIFNEMDETVYDVGLENAYAEKWFRALTKEERG